MNSKLKGERLLLLVHYQFQLFIEKRIMTEEEFYTKLKRFNMPMKAGNVEGNNG